MEIFSAVRSAVPQRAKRVSITFLLTALLLLYTMLPAGAAFNSLLREIPRLTGISEIFLLMSLDDGSVIFSREEDRPTAPASLTKVATAIVVLENCPDVKTVLTVRPSIFETFDRANSSNAGLLAGEEISVEDLLYCLLLPSANEAAQILADYIGGLSLAAEEDRTEPGTAFENVERFVDMMNELAERLQCGNTYYVNAHGLDEPGHLTSAADMAKLLRYALSPDFKGNALFETIVGTWEYKLPESNKHKARSIFSTNFMLNKAKKDYYVKGIAGIKTGFTTQAGECITAKASRDGYNYLCIVMRGRKTTLEEGGTVIYNTAFVDCKALLDWSFDHIRYQPVVPAGTLVDELPVAMARSTDHVRLVPKEELRALVPVGVGSGNVLVEMIRADLPQTLTAPVREGELLAQARVLYAGEEFARIDLVAGESVSRSASMYLVALARRMISNRVTQLLLITVIIVAVIYLAAIFLKERNKQQEKQMHVVPDITKKGKKREREKDGKKR